MSNQKISPHQDSSNIFLELARRFRSCKNSTRRFRAVLGDKSCWNSRILGTRICGMREGVNQDRCLCFWCGAIAADHGTKDYRQNTRREKSCRMGKYPQSYFHLRHCISLLFSHQSHAQARKLET